MGILPPQTYYTKNRQQIIRTMMKKLFATTLLSTAVAFSAQAQDVSCQSLERTGNIRNLLLSRITLATATHQLKVINIIIPRLCSSLYLRHLERISAIQIPGVSSMIRLERPIISAPSTSSVRPSSYAYSGNPHGIPSPADGSRAVPWTFPD